MTFTGMVDGRPQTITTEAELSDENVRHYIEGQAGRHGLTVPTVPKRPSDEDIIKRHFATVMEDAARLAQGSIHREAVAAMLKQQNPLLKVTNG